jgi:hypothetical protein
MKRQGVKLEKIAGFEGATEALSGFVFADEQSLRNALLALYWSRVAYEVQRPPMVVITGLSGVGKTALALHLSNADKHAFWPVLPGCRRRNRLLEKWTELTLNHCVDTEARVMCWDDCPGWLFTGAEGLGRFLTAMTWHRVRGGDDIRYQLKTMLVVTGCNLELPPDLERRSLRIELLPLE